jgi:hypothetical protein
MKVGFRISNLDFCATQNSIFSIFLNTFFQYGTVKGYTVKKNGEKIKEAYYLQHISQVLHCFLSAIWRVYFFDEYLRKSLDAISALVSPSAI